MATEKGCGGLDSFEGDVRCGAKDRIPQRVQEDGPGNVNSVGRQAAVILGVDLLGQGLLSRLAGGDIVGDAGT